MGCSEGASGLRVGSPREVVSVEAGAGNRESMWDCNSWRAAKSCLKSEIEDLIESRGVTVVMKATSEGREGTEGGGGMTQ